MGKQLNAGIRWLGHSSFLIETPGAVRVLIDPFLTGSPTCPPEWHEPDGIDLILCTHGHADHIADAAAVAKRCGATVVGQPELCGFLGEQGVGSLADMNKGGTQEQHGLRLTMVNAHHSSSFASADGTTVYMGEPAGYVIELEDGYRIYHAGDTCVFGDMALIGELYVPDLAMLPIGGHYTMDPREAAHAVRLLGCGDVLGMHYGTFPMLTGTPRELRELVGATATVHELEPGGILGGVPAGQAG